MLNRRTNRDLPKFINTIEILKIGKEHLFKFRNNNFLFYKNYIEKFRLTCDYLNPPS